MEPSDNPVVAAIEDRAEELRQRIETLHQSEAELNREIDALLRSRALISEAAADSPTGAVAKHDDPAPADPPRKPKRGRSSKGSAKSSANPPREQQAAARRTAIIEYVAANPGSLASEIREAVCPKLGSHYASKILRELVKVGKLKGEGATSTRRYYPTSPSPRKGPDMPRSGQSAPAGMDGGERVGDGEEKRTPIDEGPGERLKGNNSGGTLDGRILSALLTSRPTTTELEVALGVQRKDLDKALSRLMRDGDVKVTTEGDKRVLVGVP